MKRPINYPGLEGYSVNEIGEVFAKDGVSKISQNKNSKGYFKVSLYVKGVGKRTFGVSRLVALAFIPTDDTSKDVDHIDNNRENNHASNLQWLTRAENIQKSFAQGRINPRKGKIMGKNMIFYVSKTNEEQLRKHQQSGGSMSGLVNALLSQHFGTMPDKAPPSKKPEFVKPEIAKLVSDNIDDLLKNNSEPTAQKDSVVEMRRMGTDPHQASYSELGLADGYEQECCQHPTRPCKHWVWDTATGEGYRNTLSGRYQEVE